MSGVCKVCCSDIFRCTCNRQSSGGMAATNAAATIAPVSAKAPGAPAVTRTTDAELAAHWAQVAAASVGAQAVEAASKRTLKRTTSAVATPPPAPPGLIAMRADEEMLWTQEALGISQSSHTGLSQDVHSWIWGRLPGDQELLLRLRRLACSLSLWAYGSEWKSNRHDVTQPSTT